MNKAKIALYSYAFSILIIIIHGVASHIYSKHCAAVSFFGYFDTVLKIGSPSCQTILYIVNKSHEFYAMLVLSVVSALSSTIYLIHEYILHKMEVNKIDNNPIDLTNIKNMQGMNEIKLQEIINSYYSNLNKETHK